ncbi:hypothetical protein F5Y16DRAFT_327901 [Xylariaceae sp. FL0255]|nr:hypothetical protein F5Y16DRAFT_327901 [Xylariaceae sp. FL0255]
MTTVTESQARSEADVTPTVNNISHHVKTELRTKHLENYVRMKNEILHFERPEDPDAYRFLRHDLLRNLEGRWNDFLQLLQAKLPDAIDRALEDVKQDFYNASGNANYTNAVLEPSPLPLGDSSQDRPRAPIAPMSNYNTPENSQQVTAKSPQTPKSPGGKRKNSTVVAGSGEPQTDRHEKGGSSPKRPVDPETPEESPKKKAKRTIAVHNQKTSSHTGPKIKEVSQRDLENGEFKFKYEGYEGFYVLRCNQARCKKQAGRDGPIIFKSDPFKTGLAKNHFSNKSHANAESESAIFSKYALRVTDMSDREANNSVPISIRSVEQTPKTPPLPTNPSPSRSKGKQPVRPFNFFNEPTEPAVASTSAAAAKDKVSFADSFYLAGPGTYRSGTADTATACGDDDSDDGLPPLEILALGFKKKA